MKIGCVKEIKNNEFRVGLTPDNVKAYVQAGHCVYMERGAADRLRSLRADHRGTGAAGAAGIPGHRHRQAGEVPAQGVPAVSVRGA